MAAPEAIKLLVKRFEENLQMYTSQAYVEASLRQDFLDPFMRALGWDVGNTAGLAEHLREVVIESRLDIDGAKRAPDYAFRVGGINKFFLEAKKPAVQVATDPRPALQLRTYGWNGRVAYSVLSDFQEFSLYDTRISPLIGDKAQVARLHYMTYDRYIDEWDWVEERFSRESVAAGFLDRIAADERVKHRTVPVDAAILEEIESWRASLAVDIHGSHPKLSTFDLGMAVQLLLDRVLFLRICEDRGIEPPNSLLDLSKKTDLYPSLVEIFERADAKYNSGLFHLAAERGRPGERDVLTPTLKVSDKTLQAILRGLYWPFSAFNFRMLGAQVLGNVYEQFLGSVISIRDAKVVVEEKPEVKKAGGVVYTPEMVVQHILDHTLSKALAGSSVAAVTGSSSARFAHPLRVLDPACGSGSFLISVYQRLLDWFLEQYLDSPERWTRGRSPRMFNAGGGQYMLTTAERKRILLEHVYGVDIDHQAVEVTKLSLLLKVLENESAETVDQQLALLHERALPDLDRNIKCGNSLIDKRYYGLEPDLVDDEERARRINPFTWEDEFPEVFGVPRPGFDVVLGNPPYVLLQDEFRDDASLSYFHAHYGVAAFKVDTYHLFIEKATELTRAGGFCSLITPSNWLTNNHLTALRRFQLDKGQLEEVGILDRAVFARSVDCAVYVSSIGSEPTREFTLAKYVPDPGGNRLVQTQATILDAKQIRNSTHLLFTGGGEAVASAALDRMRTQPLTLGKVASVNFGKQLRSRRESPTDVVAVHPDPTANIPLGYARCYTGGDVRRWEVTWSGLTCITNPAAKRGGCWDERWQDAVNKLLCRQVGFFPDFALDQAGYQCLNTMFMINPIASDVSPWFLLGVLNSAALRAFWLDRYWDRRRTFPKVKGTYLKELPLPARADAQVEQSARDLTRRTRDLADATSVVRRQQLARAIEAEAQRLDQRVAQLFGISADEQLALSALVEASMRRD